MLGLIIVLAALGGAFYAGTRYRGQLRSFGSNIAQPPEIMTSVPTVEDPILKFERLRREIDRGPNEWLTGEMQKQLAAQGIQGPLDSVDPEFLYLYGRASLLSGNSVEAARAFEASIVKADLDPTGASATIRKEATLGLAALTVRSDTERANALKRYDEMVSKPAPATSP
jgi:hypothetical protein